MPRILAATLLALLVQTAHAAPEEVRTVIIIGVDGLSPRGVDEGDTPHMNRLLREGAHTFHARGVFPTSSSPNWASMIMGAGPEQHGITSNDWRLWNRAIMPSKEGSEGRFPSVFSETNRQRPDARVAVVYDWGGFGELFDHAVVDLNADTDGPEITMATAVREFRENRPALLFVHLDHVDGVGHGQGWHTPDYYTAVKRADDRIGEMLGAIDAADAWDSTVVIVTSDHGGVGRSHGGTTMAELEIPWIIAGAGVAPGRVITRDVNTFDTACTAAHLLGLTQHPSWIGRPVTEAMLTDTAGDGWAISDYLPAPRLSVPGALMVADRVEVAIDCESPDARITYTLDGSEPTRTSTAYRGPIMLTETTTLRARAFQGDLASRETSDVYRLLRTDAPRPAVYEYFEAPAESAGAPRWEMLPAFAALRPVRSGTAPEIGLATIERRDDQFAVRFRAKLRIDEAGTYMFHLNSDDGSRLFVGRRRIIDNDGSHGPIEVSGAIDLTPGLHDITVEYFDDHGGEALEFSMTGPDKRRVPISYDRLVAPD
jgi:hypothetical protein